MRDDAVVASILLTAVLAQVCTRGQPFEGGDDFNHNYTVKYTAPHRRAYLYRAFRDAPEHKVVVFAEVVEDAASEITHCLLQPFQQANLTIPAIVTKLPARHWGYRTLGKRTYSLEEFVPVRVDCRLPRNAKFDYAAVSLRAGDDAFAGVTEVVDVPTKRVGHVAACVGPLVSGSVSPEWLDHHEALGVERFFSLPAWLTAPGVCHGYSFVPTGKEYTDGKYNTGGDIPQNILDYLQWSGVFKPEALNLTPRASVEYLPYMPPATTYYFGQFAMMHACWYMQRYAYDFVVNVDTDEFLWLRSDFMRKPKPLKAWLERVPEKAAMIAVLRYTYPPRCQVAKGSAPIVVRSDRREEKAHYQPKMILRPKAMIIGTNHGPVEIAANMERGMGSDGEMRIKHIRDGGYRYFKDSACDELVVDPPEWRLPDQH